MNYDTIPDTLILENDDLIVAIFEENKKLFIDYPEILQEWSISPTTSTSFNKLTAFFIQSLFLNKPITKKMIKESVETYEATIVKLVLGEHEKSASDRLNEIVEHDYIYTNAGAEYQLMRDIVTKNKGFEEIQEGILRKKVIDHNGTFRGLAQIKHSELEDINLEKQEMWYDLVSAAFENLDELTADLFDLITYLWITSPKSSSGYITFHSDFALALKKIKKRTVNGKEYDYRDEDRYSIMKRVAALSTIWVYLDTKTVKILDGDNIKNVNINNFRKMFEIGAISDASDPETGKHLGIYSLEIKPSELLMPYLDGRKGTIGILDLKVFRYSHYTQREHKRLIRYLSYQWKIQSINRNWQPFKVSTLLRIMEFPARYVGNRLREKFESVLEDLQRDNVFTKWEYSEKIDESQFEIKGAYNSYWKNLTIHIEPTKEVKRENRKVIDFAKNRVIQLLEKDTDTKGTSPIISDYENFAESIQTVQQSFNFENPKDEQLEEPVIVDAQTLKNVIKKRNISLRQASIEMNLPYTSISRFIHGKSKRLNEDNYKKMHSWLKENIKEQEC